MLLLVKFVILNYDGLVIKFITIVKWVVSSLNSCKLFLAIDIRDHLIVVVTSLTIRRTLETFSMTSASFVFFFFDL